MLMLFRTREPPARSDIMSEPEARSPEEGCLNRQMASAKNQAND